MDQAHKEHKEGGVCGWTGPGLCGQGGGAEDTLQSPELALLPRSRLGEEQETRGGHGLNIDYGAFVFYSYTLAILCPSLFNLFNLLIPLWPCKREQQMTV